MSLESYLSRSIKSDKCIGMAVTNLVNALQLIDLLHVL